MDAIFYRLMMKLLFTNGASFKYCPMAILCEQTGAILKVIPINQLGELVLEAYEKLLSIKTKIVAIAIFPMH